MAYLKTPETDTLTLPSDSAYSVVMKRRATFGDQRAAQSAMVQFSVDDPGNPSAEVGPYIQTLLLRLIVSWNLTDANDHPLPITAEALDEIDPVDGQFLAAEAGKRAALRKVVQERPFANPSTAPSSDTPSAIPEPSTP